MRRSWRAGLVLGLLCTVLAAVRADRGEVRRITLQLRDVPLSGAAAALEKASGIPISVSESGPPSGAVAAPEIRASFDWQGVPFARALRDVCTRYGRVLSGSIAGYVLGRDRSSGSAVASLGEDFVRGGIRVSVSQVQRSAAGTREFVANPNVQFGTTGPSLVVQLRVEVETGDATLVARVENLRGRDDRGEPLFPQANYSSGGLGYPGLYPDQWNTFVYLTPPAHAARRLAFLEGDLFLYRFSRDHTVEIPLPVSEPLVRRPVSADLLVVLSRYRPAGALSTPAPPNPFPDLPPDPGVLRTSRPGLGPSVRLRVYTRGDVNDPAEGLRHSKFSGWNALAVSGRRYRAETLNQNGTSDGEWSLNDTTLQFPEVAEPLKSVIGVFQERRRPLRAVTFRVRNIPLPPLDTPVEARQPLLFSTGVSSAEAPRPFPYRQEPGATLTMRVLPPGGRPEAGVLHLGLAATRAGGWEPLSWLELPVAADGQVRVDHLRPGKYRVVRSYQRRSTPTAAPPGAGISGRYRNGEAEADLKVGQTLELPPLQWITEEPAPARPPRR